MGRYSKKASTCKPGKGTSLKTKSVSTRILDFRASITMSNKILLLQPPALRYFCYSSLNSLRQRLWQDALQRVRKELLQRFKGVCYITNIFRSSVVKGMTVHPFHSKDKLWAPIIKDGAQHLVLDWILEAAFSTYRNTVVTYTQVIRKAAGFVWGGPRREKSSAAGPACDADGPMIWQTPRYKNCQWKKWCHVEF